MMKALVITLMTLLGAGSAQILAQSHGGRMHHGQAVEEAGPRMLRTQAQRGVQAQLFRGSGPFWGRIAQHLDLTESQREQIQEIMQAERELNRPLMEQLREVRQELQQALDSGEFNEALIRGLSQQQAQLMAELAVSRHRAEHLIYQTVLSVEQQEKVDELRERVRTRGERRLRGPKAPNQ